MKKLVAFQIDPLKVLCSNFKLIKKIVKIAKIFVKIVTIAFYSNVYTLLCNKNTIYWNKNTTLNKIDILWHSMPLNLKIFSAFHYWYSLVNGGGWEKG